MIYLFTAAALIVGLIIGYFIGRRFTLTPLLYEKIASHSQHLAYMYLLMDELHRVKFNKWASTDQGMRYVGAVQELGGHLFILPLDDKKALEKIINSINRG